MSLHSIAIKRLLDKSVKPTMRKAISSIILVEPYSYLSEFIKNEYKKLSLITSIYDYLHEYVYGNEEMTYSDLLDVIRLLTFVEPTISPADFQIADNEQLTERPFTVKVNDTVYEGATLPVGYYSIEIEYYKQCDILKVVQYNRLVGAPGNVVKLSNIYLSYEDVTLDCRAYGTGNILLNSAKVRLKTADEPA